MKRTEELALYLIHHKVVDIEQKEVYQFGLQQTASMIFDLLIAVTIALIMNMFVDMIIFMIAFITIRQYAGGYHADKRHLCVFFSIIMEILSLLAISNYTDQLFPLTILSVVGICVLSPIDTLNNPLDGLEKKHYRKKTIISTLFWTFAIFAAKYTNLVDLYRPVCVAMIFAFLLVLIGWIKAYNLQVGRCL